MKFKDKVVWITGASSGIGEALAYEFTREGAKTILSARSEEKLEKVKNNCAQLGGESTVLPVDLADTARADEIVENAIKRFGRIDILVNNGGVTQRSNTHETSLEVDRRIMEIDYFGSITLTKNVLPYMLKAGGGYITATSSVTGIFGFPLRSAYAAAKHALAGFFETLGIELRAKNIFVTVAYPGRIRTDISLNALTKNGTPHGIMDEGQQKGMPVEKCARKYVRAVYRKKREAIIGRMDLIMVYLKRYWPGLFYYLASRVSPT